MPLHLHKNEAYGPELQVVCLQAPFKLLSWFLFLMKILDPNSQGESKTSSAEPYTINKSSRGCGRPLTAHTVIIDFLHEWSLLTDRLRVCETWPAGGQMNPKLKLTHLIIGPGDRLHNKMDFSFDLFIFMRDGKSDGRGVWSESCIIVLYTCMVGR